MPPIPCYTFSMKKLTTTLCLTLAVLLGSAGVSHGQKDPILDKQSAIQMFALSSSEWEQNVTNVKNAGTGRVLQNANGTFTLIYRPDPQRGMLSVTPSYKPNQKNKPFKIDVGVIFDRPLDRHLYETITFSETKVLLKDTANSMRPEFSVMGYLVRDGNRPPSINFTIFQRGEFPPVDVMVSQENVCPPRNGKQVCIMGMVVGAPRDVASMLDMCVSKMKNSFEAMGKSETEIRSVCSCFQKIGKAGKSLKETITECSN